MNTENSIAMNGEKPIAQVNPEVPVKKVVYEKMRQLCRLLLVVTFIGCGKQSGVSKWTPPNNSNPQTILNEVKADVAAGKYSDATAKQVWLYQNGLSYDPAMTFSLWAKLIKDYPQAADELKKLRDREEKNIHEGKNVVNAFRNFVSINEIFTQYDKTSELFAWLDANKPEEAKTVFHSQSLVQRALINAKQYRLSLKYIDTNAYFERSLKLYRTRVKEADQENNSADLKKLASRNFINNATTLVALLSLCDRKVEAQQIADKISKESDIPEFKDEIQKALNGEFPQP